MSRYASCHDLSISRAFEDQERVRERALKVNDDSDKLESFCPSIRDASLSHSTKARFPSFRARSPLTSIFFRSRARLLAIRTRIPKNLNLPVKYRRSSTAESGVRPGKMDVQSVDKWERCRQ